MHSSQHLPLLRLPSLYVRGPPFSRRPSVELREPQLPGQRQISEENGMMETAMAGILVLKILWTRVETGASFLIHLPRLSVRGRCSRSRMTWCPRRRQMKWEDLTLAAGQASACIVVMMVPLVGLNKCLRDWLARPRWARTALPSEAHKVPETPSRSITWSLPMRMTPVLGHSHRIRVF